jgi:DNA-binding CsgD family transcriptional regulator
MRLVTSWLLDIRRFNYHNRTYILMTSILFLPNPHTLLWLDVDTDPEQVLGAIQRGDWRPPSPYENAPLDGLHASCQDGILLVTIRQPPSLDDHATPQHLNRRQREVLRHLADGLTTRQIALRLRLSPRTILAYVAELKELFGTPTRAALLARAIMFLKKPLAPQENDRAT